jgi:hypothetical protein
MQKTHRERYVTPLLGQDEEMKMHHKFKIINPKIDYLCPKL